MTSSKKQQTDYIQTLETVKKQYEQYLEVSGLYKLPLKKESESVQYQTPSLKHPLTTNTFILK